MTSIEWEHCQYHQSSTAAIHHFNINKKLLKYIMGSCLQSANQSAVKEQQQNHTTPGNGKDKTPGNVETVQSDSEDNNVQTPNGAATSSAVPKTKSAGNKLPEIDYNFYGNRKQLDISDITKQCTLIAHSETYNEKPFYHVFDDFEVCYMSLWRTMQRVHFMHYPSS